MDAALVSLTRPQDGPPAKPGAAGPAAALGLLSFNALLFGQGDTAGGAAALPGTAVPAAPGGALVEPAVAVSGEAPKPAAIAEAGIDAALDQLTSPRETASEETASFGLGAAATSLAGAQSPPIQSATPAPVAASAPPAPPSFESGAAQAADPAEAGNAAARAPTAPAPNSEEPKAPAGQAAEAAGPRPATDTAGPAPSDRTLPAAEPQERPAAAAVAAAPPAHDRRRATEGTLQPAETPDNRAVKPADPQAPAEAARAEIARTETARAGLASRMNEPVQGTRERPGGPPQPSPAGPTGPSPALPPASAPDAATALAPRTAPLPAHPTEQVALAVNRALGAGHERVSMRLFPAELGRIDVHLEMAKEGVLRAVIAADKPDTLHLLQHDARGLERALQDAGIKTDAGSLNFDLRQGGREGQLANRGGTVAEPANPPAADHGENMPGPAPFGGIHYGLLDLSV